MSFRFRVTCVNDLLSVERSYNASALAIMRDKTPLPFPGVHQTPHPGAYVAQSTAFKGIQVSRLQVASNPDGQWDLVRARCFFAIVALPSMHCFIARVGGVFM